MYDLVPERRTRAPRVVRSAPLIDYARQDPVASVAVFALLLTAVVWATPALYFAYRSPSLHVTLEATGGLVTMIAGYLVFGRFETSRSSRDLFLSTALMVLGLNGFLLAFPWGGIGGERELFIWRGIVSRLLGAALFAWAASIPASRPGPARGAGRVLLAVLFSSVLLSLVMGSVINLDPGVPAGLSPEASNRPAFVGHPLVLGAQLIVMALYAFAAMALRRAAYDEDDVLLRWLAFGAVALAVARLHYFLFPSIYSQWAYTGDIFRVAGQMMFLIGSAIEIRSYWIKVADAAIVEERRSIARDLHDGIAQELALISGNARRLQRQIPDGSATVAMISQASDRALREARSAIRALSAAAPQDLACVVRVAAEEAADGFDRNVEVEVMPALALPLRKQETVRWIVSEAVTNAMTHAGAQNVAVRSTDDDGDWSIEISDDGSGFDVEGPHPGFGLTMMRERARAMGLSVSVESRPGDGTTVRIGTAEKVQDGTRRG